MRRTTFATSLLGTLLVFAPTAAAQDPPPNQLEAWPDLAAKEKTRVNGLIRRFEAVTDKDGAEEDVAEAADALVAYGPAIVPVLLRRLALPRQSKPAIERALDALDRIVRPEHANLVAKSCDEKVEATRRWAMRWLALHVEERWRELLQGFATPPEDAKPTPDPEMVFLANLALAALADTKALGRVMEVCDNEWLERGALVGRVLPTARSPAMARWVIQQMRPDDERSRVTGLRMLRSLAPKEYAGAAAVYLDASEHSVKKEAINALRAIVDGAPPLEDLSVFSAIEQAKAWKGRVK